MVCRSDDFLIVLRLIKRIVSGLTSVEEVGSVMEKEASLRSSGSPSAASLIRTRHWVETVSGTTQI
jgi:hypothetical protein